MVRRQPGSGFVAGVGSIIGTNVAEVGAVAMREYTCHQRVT